jgi:hypothetical protein
MSSKQESDSDAAAQAPPGEHTSTGDSDNATPVSLPKNVALGTLIEAKSGARDDLNLLTNSGGDNDDSRPYVYRDFSQIPEEDCDVDYEIDQEGLLQVSLKYF